MSNESQADLREATARLERDLLARLGLGTGASNEQIESAHEEILSYLEKAPSGLRAWSARQAASIDEAHALLRGDQADLSAAAASLMGGARARPVEAPSAPPVPAAAPAVAATPAAAAVDARVAPSPARAAPAAPKTGIVTPHGGRHAIDALDGDEWADDEPAAPPVRRQTPAAARRQAAAAAPEPRALNPVLKRAGLALAAVVAVVAVGFAGYQLGAPSATPAPTEDPQVTAFREQVASLMQKLAADPQDVETLTALGNLYYNAGDYASAITWIDKVLAQDPESVDALLAYGAASYNTADFATAEESWLKVLDLDPENLEAYYDLGFLYFSDNPPNIEKTREMWNKVVEISPDSQIAQTVASHLKSLDAMASASPGAATPGPGASEAPSTELGASDAPSAPPSEAPASPAATPAASAGG